MHMTTKALVLRAVDYRETDRMLTLFTREQGKLTACARGCRKKGSAVAAGCQLLAWSELVLYDYQGRWAVKEAAAERLFQGVREGCAVDERGLWELFFKTGLPEAYLAIAGEHQEYFLWKEPSKTAFRSRTEEV